MTKLPSLDIVITAHKEGDLLLPTFISAQDSINRLKSDFDLDINIVLYLDNPDSITLSVAEELANKFNLNLFTGKNGDPGISRNQAISLCQSDYIALLDGDDLWSENWLHSVYSDISVRLSHGKSITNIVYHPEYNLIFGGHNAFVRQGNINDSFFDTRFLRASNYWDALCVAPRKLLLNFPYKKNDLSKGFAHEDYHWVCVTIENGVTHLTTENTIHFKRRRENSVSVIANNQNVKCYTTGLQRYS